MMRLAVPLFLIALGVPFLAGQQARPPVPRGRQQAGAPGANQPIEAVASFDGVFKTASKKFVEVEVPGGDILRMYITRGTKFVRAGQPVAASTFHDGDRVLAEAERDQRMNLLAVRIEAVEPKPPAPAAVTTAPK